MWPYWWGKARDGWTKDEDVSINRPEYPGDRLTAWISFRSIDVMAVLGSGAQIKKAASRKLSDSIARLIDAGLVYPFVASAYLKLGEPLPLPNPTVARSYARMASPIDLRNAVYAHFALARRHLAEGKPFTD